MQTIKSVGAGLVALITCPCHLPLTLPLLLTLTGGTAVGFWLAANQWFVWLGSVVLFVGGLVLMFWMSQTGSGAQCEVSNKQNDQTPHVPNRAGNPVTNHPKIPIQAKEPSHV